MNAVTAAIARLAAVLVFATHGMSAQASDGRLTTNEVHQLYVTGALFLAVLVATHVAAGRNKGHR